MVLRETVHAALASSAVDALTLFASPRSEWEFALPNSPKLRVIERPRESASTVARLAWLASGLAWAARRERADVVLALSNAGSGWPFTPGALFIQQSLPFSREALATLSLAERSRVLVIRETMRLSAHQARLVIVQTPWMREAVATGLGISREKIEVFTPGAPELPEPASEASALRELASASESCRVLYVGNRSAYKNVDVIEKAAGLARAEGLDTAFFAAGSGGREGALVSLQRLDRAELHAAYRMASVLVMPSLVETVGLPLLEAMSVGLPVVAADRAYAHDVCGDAALYFDPHDARALLDAVTRITSDHVLRERQIATGRARASELSAARPYQRMIDRVIALSRA